jgi:hypothetical protein
MRIPTTMHCAVECSSASYLVLLKLMNSTKSMWSNNKVRELITVKVLHTSLMNITVVAFKVVPLGSYTPMPAPSPPFKTTVKLILWNGFQSCSLITPDGINVR